MIRAIDKFSANIGRVRELGNLHAAICNMTSKAIDTSDILRAEIVLAVSALDTLVHDIVNIGIIEIFLERDPPRTARKIFQSNYYL